MKIGFLYSLVSHQGMLMGTAHVVAICGLILGFAAAVLMYYFPARVIQYTQNGEGTITWVSNSTEEGKRKGRCQFFLPKLAPWLLALSFLLQLPVLALPLLERPPVAPVSKAQDPRQFYDFEERCSKRIAELWNDANREQGGARDKGLSGYTNHFNKKLNKCFAVTSYLSDDGGHLMTLIDVNESKDLRSFYAKGLAAPTDCKVAGAVCRSVQEWEALIKPYMEE